MLNILKQSQWHSRPHALHVPTRHVYTLSKDPSQLHYHCFDSVNTRDLYDILGNQAHDMYLICMHIIINTNGRSLPLCEEQLHHWSEHPPGVAPGRRSGASWLSRHRWSEVANSAHSSFEPGPSLLQQSPLLGPVHLPHPPGAGLDWENADMWDRQYLAPTMIWGSPWVSISYHYRQYNETHTITCTWIISINSIMFSKY